jgi:TPR repeat protein
MAGQRRFPVISIVGRIAAAAPILAVAMCLAAAPLHADASTGADAWARGEYAAAVHEWQGLAAQGDASAQFNLAQAYKFGKGVPQDLTKAEELFGQAAAKGNLEAGDNYGLLRLQRGDGAGALPYIEAAAERGDARAQYLLGIASFNGDIVPKDWVRAYALVTLARQAGLPQANSAISQMDAHIPLEQREQAVAFAGQLSTKSVAKLPEQHASLAGVDEAQQAVPPAAITQLAKPKPVRTPSSPEGSASSRWRVQLGAFSVHANADALWNRVKNRPELSGHPRINAGSGKVVRLLAGGFASEAEATRACTRLTASGISCLVTRN